MTIAACLIIPTISSAADSISYLELLVGLGDVAGVPLGVVLPSYMVVNFQLRADLHNSPVEAGIDPGAPDQIETFPRRGF